MVLQGRYAGKKAVIVKNYDEGTSSRPYGHALVCGIATYPRKVRFIHWATAATLMAVASQRRGASPNPYLKPYFFVVVACSLSSTAGSPHHIFSPPLAFHSQ